MTASARFASAYCREPQIVVGPDQRHEIVDRDDRRERAPRRKRQLGGVVHVRPRATKLDRQRERVDREHRQLRTPQAPRRQIGVRREQARVRGWKVREPNEHELDVAGCASRERREKIARIAADPSNPRHRLQMSRVERYSHCS